MIDHKAVQTKNKETVLPTRSLCRLLCGQQSKLYRFTQFAISTTLRNYTQLANSCGPQLHEKYLAVTRSARFGYAVVHIVANYCANIN